MGPVRKLFSTYPFASLFSTNPTSNGLRLNPGLCNDSPANNLASDSMTPGLFEYVAEERNYIFWLNFEFCEFAVWRTAYDEVLITFGGLRLGGNVEVYVFFWGGGGEEKHAEQIQNLVKHLSNWPVVGSSGCTVRHHYAKFRGSVINLFLKQAKVSRRPCIYFFKLSKTKNVL